MRPPEGVLCPMRSGKDPFTAKKCDTPVTRVIVAGCKHEHIQTVFLCDKHADILLRQKPGKGTILCTVCTNIDGHKCPAGAKDETT